MTVETLWKRLRRALPAVCFAAICVCVVVLLLRVQDLRAEIGSRVPGTDPRQLVELLQKRFPSSGGAELRLLDAHYGVILLFLFTLKDCAPCIDELGELNQLAGTKQISIYALGANLAPDEADQLVRQYGLRYPILCDAHGDVVRWLRPPATPWKVLFSKRNGRISLEDWPALTPAQKSAFHERVESLRLR